MELFDRTPIMIFELSGAKEGTPDQFIQRVDRPLLAGPEFQAEDINGDARWLRRLLRCRQTSRRDLSSRYSPRRNSWFETHFPPAQAGKFFPLW
jgi:hypothetical protein